MRVWVETAVVPHLRRPAPLHPLFLFSLPPPTNSLLLVGQICELEPLLLLLKGLLPTGLVENRLDEVVN